MLDDDGTNKSNAIQESILFDFGLTKNLRKEVTNVSSSCPTVSRKEGFEMMNKSLLKKLGLIILVN